MGRFGGQVLGGDRREKLGRAGGDGVMAKFSDVFTDETKQGHKIQTSEYLHTGNHPIIDQGQSQIAGYTNLEDGIYADVPAIIFGDHTRVIKYVDTPFFLGADGVKVLKSKIRDADYKYLFYCLQNAKIPNTGYNRHFKWLKEIEIPLPSLDEQRRIAAVLDKVSGLIAKRRAQLDKLDLLVKARFVEMFGDPETNPMNWPIVGIGAITKTIDSGWSGNGTQREKKAGEIAVLKVSAVTKGYFIPEECKVLDNQENIKKYVFPQKDDLLFSRANTKEMVGATAIIREDYPELILPDKLWKIRFFDVTNVVYMKYILSSKAIRNKFSEASTGTSGSMYNVSMEKFKAIQIPMPEIGIQNQFASFAESVEKSKLTIQQSLDKLELLKKSLMQQYLG